MAGHGWLDCILPGGFSIGCFSFVPDVAPGKKLWEAALPPSTIISLVRLMEEIVSNYPIEGPIMRLAIS